MATNANLGAAKESKSDEFYTQYSDIEAEMNAYVEFNPDVFRNKTILLPCDDPEWSTVIDWIDSIFDYTGSEMCGLEWGRLYKEYHTKAYSKDSISERMNDLFGDPQVTNKKGVIEYILSGESKPELLNVRVFDENTKRTVYAQQTNICVFHVSVRLITQCPLYNSDGNVI